MGKDEETAEYIKEYVKNYQHHRRDLDKEKIEARKNISDFGDGIEYMNEFLINTGEVEKEAQSMKDYHTE